MHVVEYCSVGCHTEKISVSQEKKCGKILVCKVIRFLYCRTTWSLLYVEHIPRRYCIQCSPKLLWWENMLLVLSPGTGPFRIFLIGEKTNIPFYICPFRCLSIPAKITTCLCNTLGDNMLRHTHTHPEGSGWCLGEGHLGHLSMWSILLHYQHSWLWGSLSSWHGPRATKRCDWSHALYP